MRATCDIRPCREDDLPAVRDLYRQLSLDSEEATPLEVIRSAFRAAVDRPEFELFVATVDGRVVGTYTLYTLANLTHNGRPAAILENIVVDSECRGLGIGRVMLEHAKRLAEERGCDKLSLTSNAKRDDAHGFYEHCGMVRHGYSFRYVL